MNDDRQPQDGQDGQVLALPHAPDAIELCRSTHRVELTLAGEALLDRARRLLRDLDDAVSATQSVGGELASRAARLLEPVGDLTRGADDLPALRAAYESLHLEQAGAFVRELQQPAEAGLKRS
jgi:DNA-binding transcriptional LysR family regulator